MKPTQFCFKPSNQQEHSINSSCAVNKRNLPQCLQTEGQVGIIFYINVTLLLINIMSMHIVLFKTEYTFLIP